MDSSISFLDILITKKLNSPFIEFSTSVYRKKTVTGQYFNFHSINLISHKKSAVRILLFRSYNYCNPDDFLIEKEKNFSDLIPNDYSKNWLRRIFNEFLHPVHLDRSISSAQPPKNIFRVPYSGLSKCLSRQLSKFNIYLSHNSCRSL